MTRRDGEALGFDLMHFPASFYFPTIFFFFFSSFFSLLSLVWSRLLLIGRRLSSLIKSFGFFSCFFFLGARLAGGFYLSVFLLMRGKEVKVIYTNFLIGKKGRADGRYKKNSDSMEC